MNEMSAVLRAFTPAVDADSNYGFYLSLFGSPLLQDDFSGTLRRIQLGVQEAAATMVSLGAATSKVLAAVASRMASPGELLVIEPGSGAEFLATLPVEALHAMDGIDASDLRRSGINTVAELRRVPLPVLVSVYGEILGRRIWRNSRALDAQPSSALPRGWLRAAVAAVVAVL
jgi:DNA polymerase-4